MVKIAAVVASFLLVIASISGCATLADAKAAKGSGSVHVYNRAYDQVWNVTLDVVKNTDLALVNDDKARGEILAQRSPHFMSYGENVAIFVSPVEGKTQTKVEVVNKRAMATNIFAPDWESRILSALDKRL